MATNTSQSWPVRAWTYFKGARWLHAFIFVEVLLLAGGWAVAQLGTTSTRTLGSPVDPHLALGGLMGAVAIVFVGITLFFLSVSLIFRVRRRMQEPVNY